jgi:hypothetical protein
VNGSSVKVGRRGWARLPGAALALLSSLAVIGVGAVSGPSRPAGADEPLKDKLIVYTSYGAPGQSATGTVVGHAYVDLVDHIHPNCQPKGCHYIYGKYPGGSWPFNTDGKINPDNNSGWSWRITYKLTVAQYEAAFRFISDQIKNPSRYKVLSSNCMEWAAEVAAVAGKSMQPYKNAFGVPEPAIFRNSLEKIGSGWSPGDTGGTVLKNHNPGSSASGAPDPPSATPPCCDADAIVRAAMNHPATMASQLGLRFTKLTLRTDHPDANGTFRVIINHPDQAGNMYGIIWGDGKRTIAERSQTAGAATYSFSHTYNSAMTGPLKVIIVENGQITQYVRTLGQTRRGSGHAETDVEPTPPPQVMYPAAT